MSQMSETEPSPVKQLLIAARRGDVVRVRELLAAGVSPLPEPTGDGLPDSHLVPLFLAAESGSAPCVRALLDAGAKVNYRDEDGETALFFAASEDVVRVLIDAGAKVDALDSQGDDALGSVLCDWPDGDWTFDQGLYADFDRCPVARALIAAGADLHFQKQFDWPRVYAAALVGLADAMVFLLDEGATLSPPTGKRTTVLHALCWNGGSLDDGPDSTARAIDRLLRAGISLEARDDEGRTPLHKAVGGDMSNESVMLHLLRRGANPNAIDIHGQTPLHLATRGLPPAEGCVVPLLGFGADPKIRDRRGKTPVELMRRGLRRNRAYHREEIRSQVSHHEAPDFDDYREHHRQKIRESEIAYAFLRASLRKKRKITGA